MTKTVLEQYISVKQEIREIEARIERLNSKLDRINREGNVKDAVKGGNGGFQTFHIEGFPVAEEDEAKYLLSKNIRLLEARKAKAAELVVRVEEYLNTLDDSRMRRMISMRYIDGLSWWKVAQRMGGRATEDSCKKQMERFLKNN
ncbi:MAG: RNA polymerase subunit sigma-70 [Clostridium sp.]|nr:RNA polymerase subunit sigma-70 [Clostridium sp.]